MSTLLNEILQESESTSCSSPACTCKHCSSTRNEILQKSESSSYHPLGCTCRYCMAARNQQLYGQTKFETEFVFKVPVPVSELSSEFEIVTLTEQVQECL